MFLMFSFSSVKALYISCVHWTWHFAVNRAQKGGSERIYYRKYITLKHLKWDDENFPPLGYLYLIILAMGAFNDIHNLICSVHYISPSSTLILSCSWVLIRLQIIFSLKNTYGDITSYTQNTWIYRKHAFTQAKEEIFPSLHYRVEMLSVIDKNERWNDYVKKSLESEVRHKFEHWAGKNWILFNIVLCGMG